MAMLYDWIKNIVYLYIFITALLHLLPKQEYRKYVRFFSGILLVILLMTPVLNLVFHQEELLDKISFESFWQEMENASLDIQKMETQQKEAYLREYEQAIGEDIKLLAEEDSIYVNQIQVTLSEAYEVEQLEMEVSLEEEGGVFVEQVILQDNSEGYRMVRDFKEKLTVFYKITEDQIQIAVQNG